MTISIALKAAYVAVAAEATPFFVRRADALVAVYDSLEAAKASKLGKVQSLDDLSDDEAADLQAYADSVKPVEVKTRAVADLRGKSAVLSPVKRVWQIVDDNAGMARKDLLALCLAEGIAYYTARTQIQVRTKAHKDAAAAATVAAAPVAGADADGEDAGE